MPVNRPEKSPDMPSETSPETAKEKAPGGREADKPLREPNPLIEMMAASAGAEDIDAFADEFAARKNAENAPLFASVPYAKRILLLPQCLRSSAHCQAKEVGVLYECAHCGSCRIPEIIAEADSLGYMGVFILKGGRAVIRLISELQPGAILGVACPYEGFIGIMECERRGIPVQFVPLTKDGCADTEVDIENLKAFLARLEEGGEAARGNGLGGL